MYQFSAWRWPRQSTPGQPIALALFFTLFALFAAAPLPAQGTADLIRGRVISVDSVPLRGVRVTVLSPASQITRTATTDAAGRYAIFFPNGEGNYVASFILIGFEPMVKQIRRRDDLDVLVADITMKPIVIQLDSILVLGRMLPRRGSANLPDSTGSWDLITGAGLTLGDLGNLTLMTAQLPGVSLVTDENGDAKGFSVLGLGSDQNIVTVDGVRQNINNIPTEDMPAARLTTTTSDPSRGGFSGAAVAVQSRPGSWQVTRSLGLTVDEPNLQFSDPARRQLGREYTNLQLSGETSGPLVRDRLFGRISFQAGHRANDRATLLNTGPAGFGAIGASSDSVGRLLEALTTLGIPATRPGIPETQQTRDYSVMMRGDLTPPGSHALNATFNGSWRNQVASPSSPLIAPARGGETRAMSLSAQLNHSFYLPLGILSESKLARTHNDNSSSAYIDFPDARVRIRSGTGGGQSSVSTFQIGGNSAMPVTTRTNKWEFINGLSWVSKDNAHRVKLGTELMFDEYSQTQTTNSLGTFSFNSLSDFVNDRPSDFRRQLTSAYSNADIFTAAFSLGDQWRRTKDFNLQYGVRVEIDHYGARPRNNARVESVLGVRNDHAPNGVYVIPRFGFAYSYGTAPQIAAFDGATRGPRATLKGTIGEYRNTPSNSLLQQAMRSSGLPGDIVTLSCVGDAVPTPDWNSYAVSRSNIPDQCADGSGGTVLAERQPAILLFADDFEAQRSWRADLNWSGTALRRFKLSVGALYSLNIAQTSSVDLNFIERARFTLPLELDRPVFVTPTSISSRSGSVSNKEARVTQDFARVTERRSDLTSMSGQFSTSLTPVVVSPRGVRWTLTYNLLSTSDFQRGFGGTTDAGPMRRTWEGGNTAMHQISTSLNYNILGFKIGLSTRTTSGARFTPTVRGDINGDGESNDRAMIFDPAATADSALANGMLALIESAPSRVSHCLREQLGAIAGVNSCRGPWSTVFNVTMSLDPMKFVLPGRTTLSMSFGNPMTGLDLLLTGRSQATSWGQRNSGPDATLLFPRGFDSSTKSFRYEVNPAFGSTRASSASENSQFLITLKFSTDLSRPMEKQKLRRDIGDWERKAVKRPSMAALKKQYVQPFTTMFESILKQRDTLGLSKDQVDTLTALTRSYTARIDSLWTPIARALSDSTERLVARQVEDRIDMLRAESFQLMSLNAQKLRAVLSKEQFNRLPASYSVYFDERQMRRMR